MAPCLRPGIVRMTLLGEFPYNGNCAFRLFALIKAGNAEMLCLYGGGFSPLAINPDAAGYGLPSNCYPPMWHESHHRDRRMSLVYGLR